MYTATCRDVGHDPQGFLLIAVLTIKFHFYDDSKRDLRLPADRTSNIRIKSEPAKASRNFIPAD